MIDTEPREDVRLTADVVVFSDLPPGQPWRVLLIRRRWEPFADCWALPGGHVDPGEDTADAAARELGEETGLVVPVAELDIVGAYAAPGRDPRGRYATFAYTWTTPSPAPPVTAADDATDFRWVPIVDVVERGSVKVAFDHRQIIADALRVPRRA